MTRPDPTDRELLEFMARFAGWRELHLRFQTKESTGALWGTKGGGLVTFIPDYLHSVDAWLRDVWPKVLLLGADFCGNWMWAVSDQIPDGPNPHSTDLNDNPRKCSDLMNADARSRCLALYRALEGKLP